MGFMDELKKLTQPYDDEEDFFEGADPSFKPQPKQKAEPKIKNPSRASQVAQVVKNLLAMWEIPGLGRSPGGGHGNPLQYSCLKNSMDRGARQTTVHGIPKSQTRPSD